MSRIIFGATLGLPIGLGLAGDWIPMIASLALLFPSTAMLVIDAIAPPTGRERSEG